MLQSPVEWPTAIAIAIPSALLNSHALHRRGCCFLPLPPATVAVGAGAAARAQLQLEQRTQRQQTCQRGGNHGTTGLGEDFWPSLACEIQQQRGTLEHFDSPPDFHRRRVQAQKCNAEAKNMAGFNPERNCN
jgi:hypothetical protein